MERVRNGFAEHLKEMDGTKIAYSNSMKTIVHVYFLHSCDTYGVTMVLAPSLNSQGMA